MRGLIESINVSDILTRLIEFLPDLLAAILILFLAWLLFRLTRGSLHAILLRGGFHEALIRLMVDNIYRFVLIIIALIMAAGQVGINIAAALAGIGVAGIAIGFAAQDSLANTLAGFMIFWDKPFEVGDWVTVADQYGAVSEITMRTTRVRTNNNTYVVIPNKSIIDEVLVNHSKHGATRVDVPVGIAYKEDIPRARQVLLEAIAGIRGIAPDPPSDLVVDALGASSVDLLVRVWISEASDERPVYFRVMEASKLALDRADIEIPYHHLQLFLEDVKPQVWDRADQLATLATAGASRPTPGN
jgi:small conductance mechanosensitive channel